MDVSFRPATAADLPAIVALLIDDPFAVSREAAAKTDLGPYELAFAEIAADPSIDVIVVELSGEVVGCLQLTQTPHLTYQGGKRATIEGVRVSQALRGQGVGRLLMEHAVALARKGGCHLVQLTTDKRRGEALRFYEALGFVATHEGMKLHL